MCFHDTAHLSLPPHRAQNNFLPTNRLVSEMAHHIRVLATKPKTSSEIPETHIMKKKIPVSGPFTSMLLHKWTGTGTWTDKWTDG